MARADGMAGRKSGKRKAAPRKPRAKVQTTTPTAPEPRAPTYVVGIGASAGGLEALRQLFSALTAADRLCLVVVQHLAPQHRSRLVELIGHTTRLNVRETTDGVPLAGDTVFITPPNADVELEQGQLRLRPTEGKLGPKPSIDRFFKSLAEEMGENGIAVVLSGTGSDGAHGVRAVKAAGGVTIGQTPSTAKYDGMPRAARQTGAIDLDLPPEEIARQLMLFNDLARKSEHPETPQHFLSGAQDPYAAILSMVEKVSKVDFAQYKQNTIRRRIERRVVATRSESLEAYADHLRKHPEESRRLFQDILISVTAFFRDAPHFRQLQEAIAEHVAAKQPRQNFRAWVVGCATGEEVYTLAMLIAEAAEAAKKPLAIQLFATDIDEQAMAVARKGVYPKAALSDVPAALRAKYFDEHPEHFKVRDSLRDLIIFARHDVVQDPPFLKLDVISCRNVLIYFGHRLQEQVLKTFHFALDDRGVLFLGKSEATTAAGELFDLFDKTAKIFLRSPKRGDLPRTYSRLESKREQQLATEDRQTTTGLEIFNAMVAAFAPDSVLVDEEFRVRHVFGNANLYLNLPRGEPSTSITRLLPQDVAVEAGAMLHRAAKTHHAVRGIQRHTLHLHHEPRAVQLSAVPLIQGGKREFFLCFHPAAPEPASDGTGDRALARLPMKTRVRRLQEELAATRDHLQTVVEEHETANEELQALNEELQSSNEELQSTNEELETTNEELQSANEELTTLNQEINVRSNELLALNQRFLAIQNAIFYPLIITDAKARIVDYNPASRFMLRVTDVDRGEHLRTLTAFPHIAAVSELVESSLRNERDGKLQLKASDRDFEIRVQLFRGARDMVEGAVVSFVENSELVHALEQARSARSRLSAILENTPALVTMKDTTGAYLYVNRRFAEVMQVDPAQVVGRTDEEIFGSELGGPLRDRDFDVLRSRKAIRVEEAIPVAGQIRHWLSSKFPLLDERQVAQSVCTVSLDTTEQVLERLQLEMFRSAVSAATGGVAIFERVDGDYRAVAVSDELLGRLGADGTAPGVPLRALLERLCGKASVTELERRLTARATESITLNLAQDHGGEDWLELRTRLLESPKGEVGLLVLTLFDANHQVRTQRLLQGQQEDVARYSKLASLGEVAAGISHEINTPLNIIRTRTDLLRRLSQREQLEKDHVLRAAAEIEGVVKNISSVIAGLKSVSNLESERQGRHDLRTLVQEALRICEFRTQQQAVPVAVELSEAPLWVECYPVQMVQILVNLINNAVDAVADLKARWIRVSAERSGARVQVRVTDSGKGIDPAIAEKIMAPFFTTKREKNGTGLGLSISRNLARRHGGELSLDGGARNTSFVLELPMLTAEQEAGTPP